MRSEARSETERGNERPSSSQSARSCGTRSCQAASESRTRVSSSPKRRSACARRRRGRRRATATTSTPSSQRSRGSSSTCQRTRRAVDLAALREDHLRLRRRRSASSSTNWLCSSSKRLGTGRGSGSARIGSPSAKSCSLTERMSAKSRPSSSASSNDERLHALVLDDDRGPASPSPTKRSRAIESDVLPQPAGERVAQVERRREVLDLAGREQQRRAPLIVSAQPREEARVLAEEAVRRGRSMSPTLVADAERRAFEDRERQHGYARAIDARHPLDWCERLDDDLVDVHVRAGRVSAKRTQSAMSSGVSGVDALVDRLRLLLVAPEADEREVRSRRGPGRRSSRGSAGRAGPRAARR